LAPEDARYAYVYAIGLNSVGRSQDALAILKQANARYPTDTDILTALATISRDSGYMADAIAYAAEIVRVAPNNAQGHALYQSLRGP
jgi:hypothetical protein